MRLKSLFFCVYGLLVFSCVFTPLAFANEHSSSKVIVLTPVEVADSNLLTAQQVFTLWESQSKQHQQKLVAGGHTSISAEQAPLWFIGEVIGANELENENRWFLTWDRADFLVDLTLFAPVVKNNNMEFKRVGNLYREQKDSPTATVELFRLPDNVDVTKPFIIKAQGSTYRPVQLHLYSEQQQSFNTNIRLIVFSACFGVLLAMSLYNLCLGLFTRDKSYFWYTANVVAEIVWLSQASGALGYFNRQWLDGLLQFAGANFLSSVVFVTASGFAVTFFNLRKAAPVLAKVIISMAVLSMSFGLLTLVFLNQGQIYQILDIAQQIGGGLLAVLIMGAAIHCSRKGQHSARYFIAAWGVLFLGLFLFLGDTPLVIANVELDPVYFVLLAASVEVILFSFALADNMNKLRTEHGVLKHKAIMDSLSGLFNQGHYLTRLPELVKNAQRNGSTVACIVFDIDRFKQFNDSYGHPQGDIIIRTIGELIQKHSGRFDMAFRSGGEEFTLILTEENEFQAETIANNIRNEFSQVQFHPKGNGEIINCSVSAGITRLDSRDTVESFVARADKALYEAKNHGRNSVFCY